MTTMLAGVGPAGRGVLTAMLAGGMLADVCDDGLVVVEPELAPGGGALSRYNVRSDSAAIVFAQCVRDQLHDHELAESTVLASILALPDGESIALSGVGQLLREAAAPLLRRVVALGGDVRLGARLTAVRPRATGGAVVTVTDWAGQSQTQTVSRLILALGGEPHIPANLAGLLPAGTRHSDELLQRAGLSRALQELPPDPKVVVVGRAHSAFAVADRLLTAECARDWSGGAVTVATRGPVRVTYPDIDTARADGAIVTPDDVCPHSHRVWRLCGLRGDSARRYRLGRDCIDARLSVCDLQGGALADATVDADLVVTATGYRTASLRLVLGAVSARRDGALMDHHGRALPGIRTIGLGSGSLRSALAGGEKSYTGPIDGVWHYQSVLAPVLLEELFGTARLDDLRLLSG